MFDEDQELTALLNDANQSMICGENFLSIGAHKNGSSGLCLNEDLMKGPSPTTDTATIAQELALFYPSVTMVVCSLHTHARKRCNF